MSDTERIDMSTAQYCMVTLTYENPSDFGSHITGNADDINRVCVIGGVSTRWFVDIRRTDRKYAHILILASEEEVARVLEVYPKPRDTPPSSPQPQSELSEPSTSTQSIAKPPPRIIAARFPGKNMRESFALFMPSYDFRGRGASLHRIAATIIQMKHTSDHQIIERLEMQQRLSQAYVDCRRDNGADMRAYHNLQNWTATVRMERVRYRPEAVRDPRHRTGPGSYGDVGLTEEGMVVDLLTNDWRRY